MAIYTRTGDKGRTSLFSGQRVSKGDARVEAYGTMDELNSVIGIAIAEVQSSKFKVQSYSLKLKTELIQIQKDLFDIGAALANSEFRIENSELRRLGKRVKEFENLIDQMTKDLPPLSNFILPGGGRIGALLHFARTVARRAERIVVSLNDKEEVNRNIIMYLNRLSDLLFTFARFVNFKENKKEIIWNGAR